MPRTLDLCPARNLAGGVFPLHRDGRSREFSRKLPFATIALSVICTSCGAVGSGPPAPVSVSVTPNSAQPFVGGGVQFSAQVQNAANFAVIWQVNQTLGGDSTVGTITSNGYYTAPSRVPNTPTVTVTAVLQANSSVSGSASVTIQSLSSIQGPLAISPKLSSVTTSQTLQLNVQIPGAGTGNSDVSWAVACVPAGACSTGTITPSGLFTPPNAAGTNIVTATLLANPSAVASATVEVTDFPGTLTWRNDNSRSGVNSQERALAPATVNSSTFGKLFSCPIDGYAYAQSLYVANLPIPGHGIHNVVFVATEKDLVYAFDADANPCQQLWPAPAKLIPTGFQPIATPNLNITSTAIVPFVGITGTPVIGMSTSALYAVAATQDIATGSIYTHRLYALDLATGEPVIQPHGTGINTPGLQFDSLVENQRPALLLDNGTIYIAFGSYGGPGDYHGWLFGYDSSSLQPANEVFNVTPAPNLGGGIWQSGGGPAADSSHNVFVGTGDGPFSVSGPVKSYSDSFLRFETSGGLSVSDYFTPCNQAALRTAGLDVGASAPILLPDSAGSAAQPHLLIGGSKEGFLYVVNRDKMGGFPSPCSDSAPRIQAIQTGGPLLSTPLFWSNSVYVAAGNGNLMSFPLPNGILALSPSASQTQETLGPQGATPVLSSNGTNNAIVWLIDTSGALATPNSPAILRAYDPSNHLNEIYNSAMVASRDQAGLAVKFTVPTVANGKVYVGTQAELDVYGLLP